MLVVELRSARSWRDWSCDETARLCWECALVRPLHKRRERGSGMKVITTPYPPPQWLTSNHPQYDLFSLQLHAFN